MTKVIDGFPNYTISIDGKVTNTETNTAKKAWLGKNGYYHVDLYNKGYNKKVAIHRLLAMHFIPNPDNKRTVNHKDGIKTNNDISNLEWATDSQNIKHAYDNGLNYCSNKKISKEAMDEILVRFFNGECLTNIVKDYDFALPTLSLYLNEYTKHLGNNKEFIDEKARQINTRAKSAKRHTHRVIGTSVTDPNDVREFNSLQEATRSLGKISSGPISNVISGRQKTAYGFVWVRS
jgi:hypothetical protein